MHGLEEILLHHICRLQVITVTTDGGITLAGLEHQIAFRLEFKRTVNGTHKHLYDVTDVRQVNNRAEQILCDFGRDDLCENVSHGFSEFVSIAFRVTDTRVFDVHSRCDVNLVACLQGDVLTPDSDIAVGGTDGNAREGIDRHRTERRVNIDGTLVALHVNLV